MLVGLSMILYSMVHRFTYYLSTEQADTPGEEVLDMLECIVCLEYPRSRPIYTCGNGHVTCAGCHSKLESEWKKGTCPHCGDRHIKQDRFVQRLADKTLQGITTACQFAQFGCRVEQVIASIGGHEEQCQYREVHCPAKHRGACQWFGALPKMVAHVREKGCIQVSQCMNRMQFDQFCIDTLTRIIT